MVRQQILPRLKNLAYEMKESKMKIVLIVILAVVLFFGGIFLYGRSLLPEIDAVVAVFHQKFNAQELQYIYTDLASKDFKEIVTYEQFDKFMFALFKNAGQILETKRVNWGIFYKSVGLTINVLYENKTENTVLREYFTFVKEKGKWKILLYDPRFKTSE